MIKCPKSVFFPHGSLGDGGSIGSVKVGNFCALVRRKADSVLIPLGAGPIDTSQAFTNRKIHSTKPEGSEAAECHQTIKQL